MSHFKLLRALFIAIILGSAIALGIGSFILEDVAASDAISNITDIDNKILLTKGTFTPTISRTIVNTTTLEEITHYKNLGCEKCIIPTIIYDWSADDKYLLIDIPEYDYNINPRTFGLATIDLMNGNKVNLFNLTMISKPNEYNPNGYLLTLYRAKFSPTGDSIFYLIGGSNEDDREPENIFKYDIKSGVNQQITNSSNVAWFDIVRNSNNYTLAYITLDHRTFHFYPQDNPKVATKLQSFMMAENIEGSVFAIGPNGNQLAFPSQDGIKYINVQSGDVREIAPHTCIGSVTFSPNGEFVIYAEYDDRGCEKGVSHVLRIASIEGRDEINELIYMDNWGALDTVVSPDGAFLATNAQGSSNRVYPEGDQNDINPRIVILQLAQPVPEFDALSIAIASSVLFALTVIVTISKMFNHNVPR